MHDWSYSNAEQGRPQEGSSQAHRYGERPVCNGNCADSRICRTIRGRCRPRFAAAGTEVREDDDQSRMGWHCDSCFAFVWQGLSARSGKLPHSRWQLPGRRLVSRRADLRREQLVPDPRRVARNLLRRQQAHGSWRAQLRQGSLPEGRDFHDRRHHAKARCHRVCPSKQAFCTRESQVRSGMRYRSGESRPHCIAYRRRQRSRHAGPQRIRLRILR